MIENIKNYFINISEEYYKKEKYDYWNEHVKYVVEYAKELALECNADQEIVEISAILHDIAKPLEIRQDESHNLVGSDIAEKILRDYKYDDYKIEEVKKCILYHSGGVDEANMTKEVWCVRNADSLSILRNISIMYFLAYKEYSLNYNEGKAFVKSMVDKKIQSLDESVYEKYKKEFECILNLI